MTGATAVLCRADGVRRRLGAVIAVAAQVGTGIGAHLVAHGCLPAPGALPLVMGAVAVGVVASGRLLRHSGRRVRVAGGQLAVHLTLSAFAACAGATGHADTGAAHVHAPGGLAITAPVLMVLAHGAGVLICLAVLERAQAAAEVAVTLGQALVARLLRPAFTATPPDREAQRTPAERRRTPTTRPQTAHGTRGPPALVD